ncbi:hypothetical protein [Microbacterium sp. C7(2022)]|uniref:hypothetical protein n=1 Tax=Microbacterium sp. C7(2022) TaxID=2992759 RepID=UPI00237AD083|nr:hypothetical protein [Microbacterium sp. C7(2022)]MDE0547415.1 hypothetical protein [Microbacterium sp. C7(2022)]
MHSDENAYCRVCGYEPADAPWGADGTEPSWEICPCCGVEFGYEDASAAGVRKYRERWVAAGAPWSDPTTPLDDLELNERLARISPRYLG